MGDLWSIDGAKFLQLINLKLKGFQDQRNYDKAWYRISKIKSHIKIGKARINFWHIDFLRNSVPYSWRRARGGKGSKQKQNEFMNSLLCCVTLQNVHNISAKTQFWVLGKLMIEESNVAILVDHWKFNEFADTMLVCQESLLT